MKHKLLLIASFSLLLSISSGVEAYAQKAIKFRHISKDPIPTEIVDTVDYESVTPVIDSTFIIPRDVEEIISSLGTPDFKPTPINKVFGPWVFLGYRNISRKPILTDLPLWVPGVDIVNPLPEVDENEILIWEMIDEELNDSIQNTEELFLDIEEEEGPDYSALTNIGVPKWLEDALRQYRIQEDFMYNTMISRPSTIDYSYWDLPVPPRLLDDDVTFAGYLRRQNLPDLNPENAILPEENLRRIYWLHNLGASLQFSQAYVSKNWYQGGNNHLALLFNFNWNVQLNQVYYPNLLFQSALTYKLALNSTPNDEVHTYSISEDVLQYNLNTGLKAFKKWFYSLNFQFKTQILRNYEQNSMKRTASFLSPGDLNLGLGMAYSHQNQKKTFQFTATISPISYNLKTCITDSIDHALFNIAPNRKTRSEIGSNAEFNMNWQITPNINYKTRLFLFTDYDYYMGDWENTLSFYINRFLSTQIYVHMRYDTSSDMSTSWKHFMLREVLSFGLTYTFSTKP